MEFCFPLAHGEISFTLGRTLRRQERVEKEKFFTNQSDNLIFLENPGLKESTMKYLTGFGNHFESEALAGSLPKGQNNPKQSPLGLIPEQLSGTAFTVDRSRNLRSWLYKIRPSVVHEQWEIFEQNFWQTRLAGSQKASPAQMRWMPPPCSREKDMDFIEGVKTMAFTSEKPGGAVHQYQFNKPMENRFFYNADGELIFIPEKGSLELRTEMGTLFINPQEIGVVPRGIKFQVNPFPLPVENWNPGKTEESLNQSDPSHKSQKKGAYSSKNPDDSSAHFPRNWCRGYLGENTGQPFCLPNLGPLGANGLANPRDFQYPLASFEDKMIHCEIVVKFNHGFWKYSQQNSPLDVVAWHGNYAPYKYDLRKFNTMGTVSYDHPDPSIYTVLTSPSNTPGTANMDFVIFPPRWLVAENSFRPPYYHRNIMSECMGLIHGVYDAKQGGFVPGGLSLHNCLSGHGPDAETFLKGISSGSAPEKIKDTMAFMFENCSIFQPTEYALNCSHRDRDYFKCWENFKPLFKKATHKDSQ